MLHIHGADYSLEGFGDCKAKVETEVSYIKIEKTRRRFNGKKRI